MQIATHTYTADVATFRANIDAAQAHRLPVKGLVQRFAGMTYDDFGAKRQVIISSTGCPDEDGNVTWTEALYK